MVHSKELGQTGIVVPEIGLGTWRYKGGVGPLKRGIELGAAFIDTAEGYYTEDVVGEAVGGIRDNVFIATKVSGRHLSYDGVLRAAEESLYNLGTDYIDLYQVHWPNPSFPLRDTMKAMSEIVDRGMARFIGVSNFDVDEMEEAQSYLNNYQIVSNQVLYNLNRREIEDGLLPYCIENGISILAYTPLDDGNLCTTALKNPRYTVLNEIADEVNKTPAQVALNWCTSHENIFVIPKTNSVMRTEENCGASGWRLSEEQIMRLEQAFH